MMDRNLLSNISPRSPITQRRFEYNEHNVKKKRVSRVHSMGQVSRYSKEKKLRADSMVSSREIWAEFRATEVKLHRPASSPVRPSAFTIPLYAVSHPCSVGFLSRAAFLARKRAPAHPPISDRQIDSGLATVAIVCRCIYACSFRSNSFCFFSFSMIATIFLPIRVNSVSRYIYRVLLGCLDELVCFCILVNICG